MKQIKDKKSTYHQKKDGDLFDDIYDLLMI